MDEENELDWQPVVWDWADITADPTIIWDIALNYWDHVLPAFDWHHLFIAPWGYTVVLASVLFLLAIAASLLDFLLHLFSDSPVHCAMAFIPTVLILFGLHQDARLTAHGTPLHSRIPVFCVFFRFMLLYSKLERRQLGAEPPSCLEKRRK